MTSGCNLLILFCLFLSVYVCTVNGQDKATSTWSAWIGWSSCSVTCGYGIMYTESHWVNELGQKTNKTRRNNQSCYVDKACPVNGNWTVWSGWHWCSELCGIGTQTRKRYCTNPTPANGGLACSGPGEEKRSCNITKCPTIPPTFRLEDCTDEKDFMCDSKIHCVPLVQRCDRKLHCNDGSDEKLCNYVNGQSSIHRLQKYSVVILLIVFIQTVLF